MELRGSITALRVGGRKVLHFAEHRRDVDNKAICPLKNHQKNPHTTAVPAFPSKSK